MRKKIIPSILIAFAFVCTFAFAQTSQVEPAKLISLEEVTKLAEQGDPESQFALADRYIKGLGVAKDDALGYQWAKKAAELGYAKAQFAVGMFNFHGIGGVAKDEAVAMSWLKKAADQGNIPAKTQVGFMLIADRGTPQNGSLGLTYLHEAASKGDIRAQYLLAQQYQLGTSIPKNPIIAYALFDVAASADTEYKETILKWRDQTSNSLSVEERATAQALSTQFSTLGIAKALEQYTEQIKKKENEVLVAKAAAEKAAQEEKIRIAEQAASEERRAMLLDWVKKIAICVFAISIFSGLVWFVRKTIAGSDSSVSRILKRRGMLITSAVAIVLFGGLALTLFKGSSSDVVGEWHSQSTDGTINFRADGTATNCPWGNKTSCDDGTWKVVNKEIGKAVVFFLKDTEMKAIYLPLSENGYVSAQESKNKEYSLVDGSIVCDDALEMTKIGVALNASGQVPTYVLDKTRCVVSRGSIQVDVLKQFEVSGITMLRVQSKKNGSVFFALYDSVR